MLNGQEICTISAVSLLLVSHTHFFWIHSYDIYHKNQDIYYLYIYTHIYISLELSQ